MSAGAEREAEAPPVKKGGEESRKGEEPEGRGRVGAAIKQHWDLGLRVAQLVLSIVCIGMIVEAVNTGRVYNNLSYFSHVATIYTAYSGYIIITGVLVFGALLGEAVGWRTSIAFSVIGAILFVATGGLIISDWSKAMNHNMYQARAQKHFYDMMCASGIFSIFNAVVFIVHAVLTFRKEASF